MFPCLFAVVDEGCLPGDGDVDFFRAIHERHTDFVPAPDLLDLVIPRAGEEIEGIVFTINRRQHRAALQVAGIPRGDHADPDGLDILPKWLEIQSAPPLHGVLYHLQGSGHLWHCQCFFNERPVFL